MIKPMHFFEVYEDQKGRRRQLYTKDLLTGKFREWPAEKSKPAAAILKGLNQFGLKPGDKVLYLGASTGTTVSHFSDIVGKDGFIFAVEFAPRVARELVFLCEQRKNVAPILADANQPETYKNSIIAPVDFLFQDIAQKNQTEIFLKNIDAYLKKGGYCLVAIKARSIDVTKRPGEIFNKVKNELSEKLILIDYRKLDPFERDHAFFVCKKK
jgi:fibrillarin-like pre-rRNA processing protein